MKKKSILAMVLLLASCVGTSSPSHFYKLQTSDMRPEAVSSRRLDIGVEETFVPKYLDRPQIVTMEKGAAELKISEFHRWAEPLSGAFSRVLADDLALYLPKSVVKYKTLSSETFTYTITLEINQMEAILGQSLQLDVWWTVYKNGQVVIRERSRLSSSLGNTYEDLANRQSALINELAQQIAAELAKR